MALKRPTPRKPRTPRRCRECGTVLDPEDLEYHRTLCIDCRWDQADREYDQQACEPRWGDHL